MEIHDSVSIEVTERERARESRKEAGAGWMFCVFWMQPVNVTFTLKQFHF